MLQSQCRDQTDHLKAFSQQASISSLTYQSLENILYACALSLNSKRVVKAAAASALKANMQMADRIISAVSDYPELYNVTLNSYRDSQRKARAWRAVSLQVEMPVDDCRNKWKNLRDTFVKFKRAEQQRRASGELDIHKKTWMHSRSMSFLTPFIQPKGLQGDTTDDLEEEERERNRESATEGVDDKSAYIIHEIEGGQADDEDAPSPDTVSGSNGPSRKRRWQMDGMDGLEDIEDEMFFFSLLPYLRKLPHRKKSAVKLKIHQLLHEAAFQ